MTDRKLLLERLERLAIVLDKLMPKCAELVRDALAMLKEQEPQLVLRNDKEFLAHIMTEICDYVIDHGEEPNDPLLVIADNIKALLERCSVNGWIEES